MSERRTEARRRRAREFEAFVAGAAGRLLHAATLLTAETPEHNPHARRLLTTALAHTYAEWDRLRGEDPYDRTRTDLTVRFARHARRHQRARGGPLGVLTPRERLIVVLRLYEGIAEEQTAAVTGLPVGRVRAICRRAVGTVCDATPAPLTAAAPTPAPASTPAPAPTPTPTSTPAPAPAETAS
ncbi:sigma factor-like helix-turn-helix DNA-binding protein [Streptomyces sp. NPDC020965]|uniref:sigma factor-like helix-turn-helix DNA-binding protein n=1 Tax=Streptomyces sp. NPDC020965 TaxID=3365105 RepID=UPI0037ACFA70